MSHTGDSIRRLRENWRRADEDTRHKAVYYFVGKLLIAGSIAWQFGWCGAIFCIGCVMCMASESP